MPLRAVLVLASQSPRRAALLGQVAVSFQQRPANIDETPQPGEPAGDYVRRMAREKASTCAAGCNAGEAVLAADTAVVLAGDILGKPANREQAAQMLTRLSHRDHQVMTAIALHWGGAVDTQVVTSKVSFATLSPAQIAEYLATGEADDKAGAYGIQGRAAAFVSHLSGSYSGVVGLPLFETVALLRRRGLLVEAAVEEGRMAAGRAIEQDNE